METTNQKIEKTTKLASDLQYLKEEFTGKLYGSCPDGDVKLYQILDFAKEYDWLLEMIIKTAKEL